MNIPDHPYNGLCGCNACEIEGHARDNISDVTDSSECSVSICMPVYNGSAFLDKAFQSVAQQTFRDFEVIIVDDGSTDDSAEHALSLMRSHGFRGRILKTGNHGPEQARDLACSCSTADIIAPFDCDDQWDPHYLEEMVGTLQANRKIDLVYCDFTEEFAGTDRVVLKSFTTPWIDLSLAKRSGPRFEFPRGAFFNLLLRGQVLFPPCTVFRRSVYLRAGQYASTLPDLRVSLDWSFGLRVSRVGVVAFLNKPLLRKIVHGANVSADPIRTPSSDVRVLESILSDRSLCAADRQQALARASIRAMEVGYSIWAYQRKPALARAWCLKSLRFRLNWPAAKIALMTLIPLGLVDSLRAWRHRSLVAR